MRSKYLLHIVLVCALPAVLAAEVQVNVRTSGSQANPVLTADGAGGSIIVWSSYFTSPGRSNDILARRLDPLSGFAGSEFVVNTTSEGNQTEPAIAADRRGDFAIAWQGPGLDQEDIFLRLFDPNGRPVTDELLINSSTAGRQLCPSVAMTDASLIVAWESREVVDDVNRTRVVAQVFEPNGVALSGAIMPDTTSYDDRYPEVAADSSGGFIIVWMQERSSHPILACLFDANGVPITSTFQVNTESLVSLTRPAVTMNSSGCFVIVWDGDPNHAGDDDIHARLYDPNAAPMGEPFVVNTLRTGAQQWPQVAINETGGFTVVWEHETGDPNTGTDIFARQFDATGQPIGDQFQLNTYAKNRQRHPDIAAAVDGSFIATWESQGQDGASYGVFTQIAAPPVPTDPNTPAP